ncbi:MAG: branched-chain amino acid ABC transporter permease [Desulfarculus sp.]|nr:branched-chain amino acid ABC transporter permease [Pseudomonadota bacterium]MBV1717690.1 branched-chain amino acid ABC transporter permease [Desulfarculus sp.]MBU4574285.1 branched-chain amino acid ABC transporter permease [Pseudomonadota bacterium]MBU4599231.1 branched-chain amino acid ABC transporter permease [Pseudomonadota bacterium]MBV1737538.1 branched-chain amino acid ABC transporter permease [Desulfarculus sp.]
MQLKARHKIAGIIVGAVVLLAAPYLVPYQALATQMLIFAIFAIGFDIIFGYTGLLSFGHAAFFGLGAYGTGLSLIHLTSSVPLALGMGILLAVVVAIPMGFLSTQRHGIYFAMVTLAFAQLIYFIAFQWRSLTGGDDGLQGVPRPSLGPVDLSSDLVYYYFVMAVFILALVLGVRIIRSPFGRALQALRENTDRAMSVGYDPRKYKLISFVISAGFAALAGGLYAMLQNFVPLFSLGLDISGEIVLMTLVGGMGTIYGPVIGAMSIVYVKDFLSSQTDIWPLIMGVLYVVSVMTFRRGVVKELKERFFK